ncbi:MAG: hypothetical protein Q8L37_03080 [Candidatus Gottesmanbacteria bacterium]|nr:hypothetical protein [Candidatus Gottesmanbacteria bacterium]
MSENTPSNPQFVGQGDASKQTREALPKDEMMLNPEQKQVVEVMQRAGKEFEKDQLDAREMAATQLKALHGKELVDAGLNQMKIGVWETVKSQLKWTVGGGLVGAIVGGIGGSLFGPSIIQSDFGRSRLQGIIDSDDASRFKEMGFEFDPRQLSSMGPVIGSTGGAVVGAKIGETIGFETAGLVHNKKIATKNNLPPVKWYDWVISNVGLSGMNMLLDGRNIGLRGFVGRIILNEVFNPLSVAGMRAVGKGLWEMRKG